jgi:hypothetical protein
MSKDNRKNNYFDDNFFNDDDLDSKENTADFLKNEIPSQRSNERGSDKNASQKTKGTSYIQNYRNNYKNTGYTDMLKKKMQPQTNFSTNNNTTVKLSNSPDALSGMNTINYEANFGQEVSNRELRENNHSPANQKLVDALQNIDKNIFVKITNKNNKKIENFQVRRASNFREKQKNSLSSLENIISNNKGSSQNIAIVSSKQIAETENSKNNEKVTQNSSSNTANNTANNSRSKLYQRNMNASQTQQKSNENVSENNNETMDEFHLQNSRNISQQTNQIKSSESKKDANPTMTQTNPSPISNNNSFHTESVISENKENNNVYKRPTRNHKRDMSQDVSNTKHNKMNRTAEVSLEKSENFHGLSDKNLKEFSQKSPSPSKSIANPTDSQKHFENVNSIASLSKNIIRNTSPMQENKLEISTITDHPRSNVPFIYDESIKDHASEEKEINVDRLMHINKRFLEIMKTQSEENVSMKTCIPISIACKISNEIISEMKGETDKEILDLMQKNKSLQEKHNEITQENTNFKENLLKTNVTNNNNDKSYSDMNNIVKDLQKYILKLEKENVVLKNEFINNIKSKNGLLKKFNDDLNDYQRISTTFFDKFSQLNQEEDE